MKAIFLLLLALLGCTQKYRDYDLIRKVDFHEKTYERPLSVFEVTPKQKDSLDQCFSQWLFFANAEKEKEEALPMIVKTLCPGNEYLLNASFTETWWTTIIYSRACVEVLTVCADERKKK